MDFQLSLEQQQFRDSIARLVDAQSLSPTGMSARDYGAIWRAFAELGMTGLCLSEADGGFSGAAEDVMLAAMELGRAPVGTPRIEIAAMAAHLLSAADTPLATTLREAFVGGTLQPAIAIDDGLSRPPRDHLVATARSTGGYELNGLKTAVIGGESAECVMVTASLGAGRIGVFALSPDIDGIACAGYRMADTTPVADFTFIAAHAPVEALLLDGPLARASVEAALDLAVVAQCATAVGSIDHAITMTVEYLKTREQFGRPLAEFQALQHQVADLFIAASDARSIVYAAVAGLSSAPEERRRIVSACKVKVAHAAKEVTGGALHLHGGIGFTTEYAIGHHLRRALVDEKLLGDTEYHLARHLESSVVRRSDVPRAPIELASVAAVG